MDDRNSTGHLLITVDTDGWSHTISLCTVFQNTCAAEKLFISSFTFSLLLVDK